MNIGNRLPVLTLLCLTLCLSACQSDPHTRMIIVKAREETTPVPHDDDAADDPAIWENPANPEESLILGTDKRGGLQVLNLNGEQFEYLPVGRLNNVDLRPNPYDDSNSIVVATQRDPSRLVLFLLEHDSRKVRVHVSHDLELPEPYGICASVIHGKYYAVLNDKNGTFQQYEITSSFELKLRRTWATETQPEGCVVDDTTQTLYLGEEEVAIWKTSAIPQHPAKLVQVAQVGENGLKADIEGLTLYHGPATTYLIASSQGSSSFVVFDTEDYEYLGSFRVGASKRIDGTTETDGIAASTIRLRGMEEGILVVQDDENTNPRANQNFKIVSWTDIRTKLILGPR